MVLEIIQENDDDRGMSEKEKRNPFELLTVQEVAAEKRVTTTAVYNAMKPGGPLRVQKLGKIHVLLRADVDAWEPQRRGPSQGWKQRRREEGKGE